MSKHDDNSGKPYYQDLLPDAASVWFPLIDTMPMWFWTCDADYALTYVGSNVTSVTGIEPKALLGLCILSQEQEGTYTNLGTQAYHDVLLSREPFQSLCYERRLESGDRAVLMDSGVPVFDDAGGFLGYHGVTFHLSEAVQTAGETASLIHALRSRAELLERELSDRNRQLEASNKLLKEVV